ncbi:hypothetical protein V7075_25870 [Neobacillus drentensis]|jgi:hypothetical protein|uniref:hypothetical protein n=1 Tax=Bacillaceae TaxID=186817 RepID=UPI000BA5521A|nr:MULTISPECIES: hypothetical protein [Bacillaceae]PAE44186.1 hypothetical protein CHI06_02625 [Bacillus sp. 7884-1]TDL75596.1 hypothetical protein E2R56_07305 [Rhodococcus qingshengii]WHZ00545.1 hypothetical protein QNH48_15865 [Neobacillus sp. YX16]
MSIETGMKYQISQNIKGNFNSADSLTVTTNNGITIQFTLDDGKGHGSMPLDHLNYLLKRSNLTPITSNKRVLLNPENEEKIG